MRSTVNEIPASTIETPHHDGDASENCSIVLTNWSKRIEDKEVSIFFVLNFLFTFGLRGIFSSISARNVNLFF